MRALTPGYAADVSVLWGHFVLRDNEDTKVVAERLLRPGVCLRAGQRFDANSPILPQVISGVTINLAAGEIDDFWTARMRGEFFPQAYFRPAYDGRTYPQSTCADRPSGDRPASAISAGRSA